MAISQNCALSCWLEAAARLSCHLYWALMSASCCKDAAPTWQPGNCCHSHGMRHEACERPQVCIGAFVLACNVLLCCWFGYRGMAAFLWGNDCVLVRMDFSVTRPKPQVYYGCTSCCAKLPGMSGLPTRAGTVRQEQAMAVSMLKVSTLPLGHRWHGAVACQWQQTNQQLRVTSCGVHTPNLIQ